MTTHNIEAQRRDPGSILNFYRAMLKLRNSRPSIARGSFEGSFADGLVLGFQRALGRERTLVLVNHADRAATVTVPDVRQRQAWRAVYPRGGEGWAAPARGTAQITLPALSVRVYAAVDRR